MVGNQRFRWSAVVLALSLMASACGGDSNTSDVESGADQTGSDDAVADDTGSEQASTDSADSTDTDSGAAEADSAGAPSIDTDSVDASSDSGDATATPVSGELDCDQLDTALDSAGALVGGDPALFGSSPEQQFEEARATMLVLKEQAPEIASEVDQTIAGLDVIAAAFAEIGWDTDFESDPVAAVRLVQLAFSDPAVSAMIASVASIGAWLASNCSS